MVELPDPDPLNAFLQLSNRSGHTVSEPIGQRSSDDCANNDQYQGTPQCRADRSERFQNRLLRNHGPTEVRGANREGDNTLAYIAGRRDRRSIRGPAYRLETVKVA